MGNFESVPPRPEVVLVPPVFERHLRGRNRMARSSYDVLFSKLQRKRLFEDYFAEQHQLLGRVMLQPPEDTHVDIISQVGTPYTGRPGEIVAGKTVFRWQRSEVDPDTFVDVRFSNDPMKRVRARACTFDSKSGVGIFAVLPLLSEDRTKGSEVGIRYGSTQYSVGMAANPTDLETVPRYAWAVGRFGNITAGVQFRPLGPSRFFGEGGTLQMSRLFGDGDNSRAGNLDGATSPVDPWRDWSLALSYGTPFHKAPLAPAFEVGMEIIQGKKLVASYFHHLVVQRRVKNPFEEDEVVGITNYVDVGFEIEQGINTDGGDVEKGKVEQAPLGVQLAASWQANKNVLIKGKLGSSSSGIVFAFKSWWQPSITLALTVRRDYAQPQPLFGAVLSVENFGGVSYERADPNYRMMTPTKQHVAGDSFTEGGKRPMMKTVDAYGRGSKESFPVELKPSINAHIL